MRHDRHPAVRPVRVPAPRRRWLAALAAVAAICLSAALLFHGRSGLISATPPLVAELAAASHHQRAGSARLSGFAHAAPGKAMRDGRADDNVPLLAAAARAQASARERGTAEALHAYGVARLLLGRPDEAVRQFEEAIQRGGSSAIVQSDLAAAYLSRADAGGSGDERFRALAAADRAVALDPHHLEARFNRALALESLGLVDAARREWHDYAASDTDSQWADEARTHVASLPQPFADRWRVARDAFLASSATGDALITTSMAAARDFVERELLPAWAQGHINGDDQAAALALERAARLAETMAARSRDRFFVDEIAALRALAPANRQAAAAALIALAQVRTLHDRYSHEAAESTLAQARPVLVRLRLPASELATLLQGQTDYYLLRRERAAHTLADLGRRAAAHAYFAVAGRAESTLGILLAGQARYAEALDAYERARRAYHSAADATSAAYVDNLVAEVLHLCGMYRDSFRASARALAHVHEFHEPRRVQSATFIAAAVSRKAGLPEAAIHFQRAFVDVAEASGVSSAPVEGRIALAVSLGRLERTAEARGEFARAEAAIATEPELARQRYLTGELLSARGAFELEHESNLAARDLTAAVETLRALGRRERIPQLYLELARAHRARGAAADAADATRRGMEALTGEWLALTSRGLTASRLDQLWQLIGDAAGRQFDAHDAAAAFRMVEGFKSALARRRPVPGPVTVDVAARVTPGVGVLFLVPTADGTLAWTITAAGQRSHRLPIPEGRLGELVRAIELDLPLGRSTALEALHAGLLAPLLRTDFARVDTLAVSAIGPAARVPWTALRDAASKRYLVQDYTVSTFPDAEFLVSCASATSRASQVLVVSNPATADDFMDLPPLPETLPEGRAIGAAYPSAHVTHLSGAAATRVAFIAGARDADTIHFGGHAVALDEAADAASLVLAGSSRASALLSVTDVERIRLARRPVVVLAACRTADAPPSQGPGLPSLASAFLGVGASHVVATLWPVEDGTSRAIAVSLHEGLAAGMSPAAALRRAIVRQLAADPTRPPRTWGAYQVSGCMPVSKTTEEINR